MMGRNKEVVPIRTQDLVTCMTCPICNMILKDATTINECLHTFCRKCIQDMITIEGMDHCPECNEYLGCTPLEKLRSDHSIQGFNDTIMKGIEGAEKKPRSSELLLPAPRKEKSLSSFATSPKAKEPSPVAATSTGRKKSAANKLDGAALSIEEPIQKAEDNYPRNSSPPVTVAKLRNKKNSNAGETSKQKMPRKGGKDRPHEPLEGLTDLLKPLVDTLAEGEGMTKNSGKAAAEGPVAKSAPPKFPEAKGKGKAKAINKAKSKEAASKSSDVHIDEGSSKAKKNRGGRKKKDIAPEGSNVVAPQAVVDAVNSPSCGRVNPIWLTLLASDAREGYATLPPIPSPYLMIKNSDLPVSFVQKYLVKKLDLNTEAHQVEITLHGQPVPPTLPLQQLVELWLQTVPKSGKIKTTVGSSAKDYTMVLRYALKVQQYS